MRRVLGSEQQRKQRRVGLRLRALSFVAAGFLPLVASAQGPVASYAFNETAGTTAADASGNGLTGTLTNGPTWVAGRNGNGVRLDGLDDYVSLGNPTALQPTGSMTISAWINSSAFPLDDAAIVSKRSSDPSGYQLDTSVDRGPRTIGFKLTTGAGTGMFRYGATTLQLNTWYHVAGVYDAAAGTLNVYLNGQLDNGALVGTVANSQQNSSQSVQIGQRPSSPGSYNFAGTLDDVHIYSRALTPPEIQAEAALADRTPPSVSISSPANGAAVDDVVAVTANASDNSGIAGVQLIVDGADVGAENTSAPYALSWDTYRATNGAHTLSARARDTSGNVATSAVVSVTVANTGFFTSETLVTGLDLPVAIKFLPSGRMLVAEFSGAIRVLPPPYTQADSTPFLQLTDVPPPGTAVDRGIMDLALDPNFSSNRYYYIFYTAGTPRSYDRLSRFTANASLTGTIAGSEVVLYQDPQETTSDSQSHHGGAITFGSDGRIYFTAGDHFVGSNAQSLATPRGKLHRINPDGTVPTDNPFYDGAGPHWDSIWAIGLRNPYRAYYDATTGRLLIGDVGGNDNQNSVEELDVGARGANYGWPDVEGFSTNPALTNPIYAYGHAGRDASITGGFVYHGTQFPTSYQGTYFFADYTQNWIRRLSIGAAGAVTGAFNFEPPDGSSDGPYGDIVYLTEGPDGALYYADIGYSDVGGSFGVSKIRRIRFVRSDLPPIASTSATPQLGPPPLTVDFSSAGSTDPEGGSLTYQWTFGDGGTSTSANPRHVYADAGLYQARLSVSDGVNSTLSNPIAITVGNTPVASLSTTPSDGGLFRAGDTISFGGEATDAEDGTLPASAFTWNIDFLHEGHVHPGLPVVGVKSGSFTIPTSGHDFTGFTRYRIKLTVTDSDGLQAVQTATVFPAKVNLSFDTVPSGLVLYVDGVAHTAPFVYDTLIGFMHTIEARNQTAGTSSYAFQSWSDGGTQLHAITVPAANSAFAASFSVTTPPPPSGLSAGYAFNETSGTTAADASGNGLTGTLTNGPTWVAGRNGNGVRLDGADDFVSLGNPTALQLTGSMTIGAWINSSAFPADDAAIVSKRASGQSGFQLDTSVDRGPRTIGFKLSNGSGPNVARYGATTLQPNTWYHVAGVFDASAQTLNVYLNGQLDNGALVGTVGSSQQNSTQDVQLGQRPGKPGTFNFAGTLDDVRIYSRALTAAEVQATMATPVGPPSAPDLTLTKAHTGSFAQGQVGATYTLTARNAGGSATGGAVTVTDALPTGLTATAVSGSGWSCTVSPASCTRSDALAAGASYPAITLTVTVAANAAASLTNSATVSGGGDTNGANNAASDPTTIASVLSDLTISKTHAGSFTQGQTGATYSLIVSNVGTAASSGVVTASDTLPTGLTATNAAGTGWSCSVSPLVCTRSDALAAGASYPAITLTVNVAANAASSLTNTATVSGGGDANGANNAASDPTVVVQRPDLALVKSHVGNFAPGQLGATYTLAVSNLGPGPSSGTVTVTDVLPTGLAATALSGTGWSCVVATLVCTRSDVLAAGGSYPPITLTVNVSAAAPASVTNSASLGGGGDANAANNAASDVTAISSAGPAALAAYAFNETNGTTAADASGNGLTGTLTNGATWVAGKNGNGVRLDGANDFVSLGNPTALQLTGSMTISAWINSSAFPADDAAIVSKRDSGQSGYQLDTTVDRGPRTIGFKLTSGAGANMFRYGATTLQLNTWYHVAGVYDASAATLNVYLNGQLDNGALVGTVTSTQQNSTQGVQLGQRPGNPGTFNFAGTLDDVRIYSRALTAAEVQANMATPVGQPSAPDLTLTKAHTGSFAQGQVGATYTLTARNAGGSPTSGAVTVADALPTGLTATAVSGSGWSCTVSPASCTRSDALAAGASYPAITLTVTVAGNAAASLTNSATVSGGGDTNGANNTASDPTTVTAVQPDLTVTKTHAGSFTQGQVGATYTLTVRNSGNGPTSGSVSLTDTLPTGLTATNAAGTGWSCSVSPLVCTRSDALAAGASYPAITLTVNVAANAVASLTNTATVSGGGDANGANNSASDPTVIASVLPDLTISKTHAGSFTQGQFGATYSLLVSNAGGGPTSGTITVTDPIPNRMTATAASGTGWSCTVVPVSCTRGDALGAGASYPAITLTVDVAPNAPASITNTASVSGGGQTNTANDSSSDPTAITPLITDLTLTKGHTGSFAQGQVGATYVLQVSNAGNAPTSGTVTVTDALPAGLTATAFAGTGWSCTPSPASCTRSDALAGGASYPPLTLTVNVAANAPASLTNGATVSGGGDSNAANNTASDATTITGSGPAPIAAYTFSEGSGSSVLDVSGNANNGTVSGATWTGSGKYGSALSFDGTSSRVIVPNSALLQLTTAMTLEAWVNPTAVTTSWRDVVYKGNDNYFLMVSTTQGSTPAGGGIIGGSGIVTYGTATVPTNTWTHLATTYDGSLLRLYVNGTQVSSLARTGLIATSTYPLEIGSDSVFGQYFAGLIDEVRVYNVALTAAQIQADMNTTTGSTPVTAPTQVVATPVGVNRIDLTWTASTSSVPIASYRIERCQGSGCIGFSQIGTSTTTSYSDLTVAPNTTYTYRLQASDTSGSVSAYSFPVEAFTGLSISPGVSTLTSTRTQQFAASGFGTGSRVWLVDGVVGGSAATGTISNAGLYAPPATEGRHTVTVATSDLSQSIDADVYVTNYPGKYTHHNDNLRSGQNVDEFVLTPQRVNFTQFGKVFSYPLDGVSYSSPLYVANVDVPGKGLRNVVYTATAHDSVYAFDADGLSPDPLWLRSFIDPANGVTTVPAADTGECCDIAPEIGISSTPVIDPANNKMYVVVKTKEVSGPSTSYVLRLRVLDIRTGADVSGSPVVIQGSVSGSGVGSSGGQLPFSSLRHNQRTALLLSNGVVYLGFASHGDNQPYHGWVLGYDATTLQRTLIKCVTPNNEGGGIWQSGGGLAADASGNIYFITGDGTFTVSSGGSDYGDTYLKMSPGGSILDYFTPHDQLALDVGNHDLGSGGLLLLPDQSGSHPRMLTSAGKNNVVYLIDRDSMGQYNTQNDNQIVQTLTLPDINYSMPVYFNGRVYYAPVASKIRAYELASGQLSSAPSSQSAAVYAFPGAVMAISGNGASGGVLWAVERRGDVSPGVLHAYDATNVGTELYNSDLAGAEDALGIAAKFNVPLVANGRVYVGGLSQLTVYGLLP